MKFSEDRPNAPHQISAYGNGWIQAGGKRWQTPCIVSAEKIIEGWTAASFTTLRADDLQEVFTLPADIILLGSGPQQQLPSAEIQRALIRHGRGFEVMTTDAACRTHNLLLAEQRTVVSVLFP